MSTKSTPFPLLSLPPELILDIYDQLDLKDQVLLSLANKYLYCLGKCLWVRPLAYEILRNKSAIRTHRQSHELWDLFRRMVEYDKNYYFCYYCGFLHRQRSEGREFPNTTTRKRLPQRPRSCRPISGAQMQTGDQVYTLMHGDVAQVMKQYRLGDGYGKDLRTLNSTIDWHRVGPYIYNIDCMGCHRCENQFLCRRHADLWCKAEMQAQIVDGNLILHHTQRIRTTNLSKMDLRKSSILNKVIQAFGAAPCAHVGTDQTMIRFSGTNSAFAEHFHDAIWADEIGKNECQRFICLAHGVRRSRRPDSRFPLSWVSFGGVRYLFSFNRDGSPDWMTGFKRELKGLCSSVWSGRTKFAQVGSWWKSRRSLHSCLYCPTQYMIRTYEHGPECIEFVMDTWNNLGECKEPWNPGFVNCWKPQAAYLMPFGWRYRIGSWAASGIRDSWFEGYQKGVKYPSEFSRLEIKASQPEKPDLNIEPKAN